MFYKKLLISCVVSSLLLGAEGDKTYEVDFGGDSASLDIKTPAWDPELTNKEDYLWDSKNKIFVLKTFIRPATSVTASFVSEKDNWGILRLSGFTYVNALPDANLSNCSLADSSPSCLPLTQVQTNQFLNSRLKIQNGGAKGFKRFVLSNANLYSGTNLQIDGFKETTLEGSTYLYAGDLNHKTRSYGANASSLRIDSEKDFSSLTISSNLNLNTYNSHQDKTKEKPIATFEANIKGNIYLSGYTRLQDKATLSLNAGNLLSISSSINIDPQEAMKITQDSLGNQSIAPDDRIREANLTLTAPKIELSGSLNLGTGAREVQYRQTNMSDGSIKTEIAQIATDIGMVARITADIEKKQDSKGEAPSKDWEVTKSQFLQTSSANIIIGKNSQAFIRVINNKPVNAKDPIFGEATEKDPNNPYAITLSNIKIEDQAEDVGEWNLSVKAMLRDGSSVSVSENVGKVLFGGKVDLGKNARASIASFDGFVLGKNSYFLLANDSQMVFSSGKSELSIENEGKIETRGGAIVFGSKLKEMAFDPNNDNGKFEGFDGGNDSLTLVNKNNILIADSQRSTTEPPTSLPDPGFPPSKSQESEKPEARELEPAGMFLLAKENVLDNQGSLIFDGFGNLTTITKSDDTKSRSLEIKNSLGKKGRVEVRGSKNTIISSANLAISSQDISISSKTVEEGEKDDKKQVTYEGELIFKSTSRNPNDKITIGSTEMVSGRDRVSIIGGTIRMESRKAGVDSYNLRLIDTTLDLSNLAKENQSAYFVNHRRLELGGGVKILTANREGMFINGVENKSLDIDLTEDFEDNGRFVMKVRGQNFIAPKLAEESETIKFSFKNHSNLELRSNALLNIVGNFYNSGTTIFQSDKFGVGSVLVSGDIIFDMTRHLPKEDTPPTVNPLIAINHSNFYSLNLDTPYLLFASQNGMLKYQVKQDIYDGGDKDPKGDLSYSKLQGYLKQEMENYLNAKTPYEGNENDVNEGGLGVFLKGVAIVNPNAIGFQLTRSDLIAEIKGNASLTGVVDQYFDILAQSDYAVSADKVRAMKSSLLASNPRALEILNNALESKNSLELGILKDIGGYETSNLILLTKDMDRSLQAMADIKKPLFEDFQKMQIVREIAVQNRLMRFSNPYMAEIELAQLIQNISANRYAQTEIQSDVKSDFDPMLSAFASYLPQDGNLSFKHGFWASAITSTTKEVSGTSTLYGLNAGYEYAPVANVLLGGYLAYGYSDSKGLNLANNAHNIDATIYARLYYKQSELDLTFGFMQAFNSMSIENTQLAPQKLSFGSNAFDFSVKYGYIFKIKQLKGLFIKPQGSYTIYGVNIPELRGDSVAPIVREKQLSGGMIFNLGAEIRQYVSAYSFLYLLPSFEYNLMGKEAVNVTFAGPGTFKKLPYTSHNQASGLFSLYAGGEGYISPNFSLNLSAGYKAGLDQEEHNISISAGLKFKF